MLVKFLLTWFESFFLTNYIRVSRGPLSFFQLNVCGFLWGLLESETRPEGWDDRLHVVTRKDSRGISKNMKESWEETDLSEGFTWNWDTLPPLHPPLILLLLLSWMILLLVVLVPGGLFPATHLGAAESHINWSWRANRSVWNFWY